MSVVPTVHDREVAHEVVREWYRETPAMDAQLRTVGAQRGLEDRIARAVAAARAPFLALADEYQRHADLIRAQEESVGGVDVVQRWRAFEDAAETIRRVEATP